MPPLRIGLVGCGRLAERGYAPALEQAEGVELAGVADPVAERCAQVAPGVSAFSSASDLVAAGGVDALVLATPAEAHFADAHVGATAGLHVLVEKPPAATLAEMVELARLRPTPYFAFNRRFVPKLARLRSALPDRGRIELTLEMRTRPGSWGAYVADDDVLLNLGPHLVDLARWLSGAEINRVSAALSAGRAALEVDLAGGRGGARITCSDGPYRERVISPAGRYSAGGPLEAFRLLLDRRPAQHPLVPSLARQLEAFARAVREEPEPDLAGADDGLAVMATLEAARASAAADGDWRSVDAR